MKQFTRKEILTSLWDKIERKEPIVACGAGAGIIAKAAQNAGIDFIYTSSTAKLRADGLATQAATLPFIDSNDITRKMAQRLLPIMDKTPVLAGIGAFNVYGNAELMIKEMMDIGYSGITNIPSVGQYGDEFCGKLEKNGFGYSKEVEMIKKCNEQDFFTATFAYKPEDAALMAKAGADVIIAKYQYKEKDAAEDAFESLRKINRAACEARKNVIVMIQCCPFTSLEQVQQALLVTEAQGFVGASAIEKAPVQKMLSSVFCDILNIKR